MTRAAAVVCVLTFCAAAQAPAPVRTPAPTPKPIASYTIDATLNPEKRAITATQTLTWLNDSPDTVPALQFHLYLNAFKNEKSTFFRGLEGAFALDPGEPVDWGYIDIHRLQLAGGADLTARLRFIQPDDRNPDDQTVAEVTLPTPVPPGGLLRLEVDFTAKLPRLIARTGYHGDFFLGAQWFPKLGVWETAGFRQRPAAGWNCHQFHANSEFYANFGNYRVSLTLPRRFEAGATGVRTAQREDPEKGVTTHVFEQDMVTDFAFTAQPGFLRFERDFDPERHIPNAERIETAQLLGLDERKLALPRTRMILLLQPEHRDQVERHFRALQTALKWYGLWFGPYPHATITLVVPPYGAGRAEGMEYPAFITGGTRWREPATRFDTEEVVIHEFGHQYFKELIATNEFEEPWLDEGFTHFTTTKILTREYGPSRIPVRVLGVDISKWLRLPLIHPWSQNRITYLSDPVGDDLQRFSWQYRDSGSYGRNAYVRAALTLRTLEGVLGEEVFARVLRAYATRWRFGHPSSHDFRTVAEEVSGRDLGWFFEQFVFGNRLLDYRVGDVASEEVREPLGVFDSPEGGRRTLTTRKDSSKPAQYESTVILRRMGDAIAPVEARITFDDGHVETKQWDGQYRWVRYTFLRPHKIVGVTIDPGMQYHLDVNFANNSWQSAPQTKALTHWGGTFVFWLQKLFLWSGALI